MERKDFTLVATMEGIFKLSIFFLAIDQLRCVRFLLLFWFVSGVFLVEICISREFERMDQKMELWTEAGGGNNILLTSSLSTVWLRQ